MLKLFPGRFLEEIDRMDWGRFQRAMLAERLASIEAVRMQSIQGLIKYEHISDADLEAMLKNDEIIERWQLAKL